MDGEKMMMRFGETTRSGQTKRPSKAWHEDEGH